MMFACGSRASQPTPGSAFVPRALDTTKDFWLTSFTKTENPFCIFLVKVKRSMLHFSFLMCLQSRYGGAFWSAARPSILACQIACWRINVAVLGKALTGICLYTHLQLQIYWETKHILRRIPALDLENGTTSPSIRLFQRLCQPI